MAPVSGLMRIGVQVVAVLGSTSRRMDGERRYVR